MANIPTENKLGSSHFLMLCIVGQNNYWKFKRIIKKRQPVILSNENQSNWLEKTTTFREILDSSHNVELNSVVIDSPLKRN